MFAAPLWSLGFRPFYLLGAVYGAILIPLWILHLFGAVPLNSTFEGSTWHAHEVIFGFAVAVLTGFLFTAVKNWTGYPTPTGWQLAGLATIWLLARVLLVSGPSVLASLIDLAYLPLVGLGIGLPIWKSRNRRNYIIMLVIFVLFLINLYTHARAWDIITFGPEPTLVTGLNLFALLITIVAGRVIPMFINNSVPGANAGRISLVEIGAIAGMIILFVIEALRATFPNLLETATLSYTYAAFLILLTSLHLIRIAKWSPHKTLNNPMLWIMPLSYFWLTASVAFRAMHQIWPQVEPIIATHLLGVGAMGGMMLAMMTRSALGHTGRAIKAGKFETACFVLIQIAVIARIASIVVTGEFYTPLLHISATSWALAFGLFTIRYWPIVTGPKV
jgi:uncharacterized protein involved in response to NO